MYSNEIKAKVMAQYIGQPFKMILNSGEFKTELLTIGMLTLLNDEDKLILKPLSEITYEHAIEVAKIYGVIRSLDGDITERSHKEKIKTAVLYVTLKYGGGRADAYQYLTSQGYDLPHYLLNGQTLQQAGMAVYKTKTT